MDGSWMFIGTETNKKKWRLDVWVNHCFDYGNLKKIFIFFSKYEVPSDIGNPECQNYPISREF